MSIRAKIYSFISVLLTLVYLAAVGNAWALTGSGDNGIVKLLYIIFITFGFPVVLALVSFVPGNPKIQLINVAVLLLTSFAELYWLRTVGDFLLQKTPSGFSSVLIFLIPVLLVIVPVKVLVQRNNKIATSNVPV